MRAFTNDVLVPRGISVRFKSSDEDAGMRLGLDCRRQLYLVFKEGVNNMLRHSRCTEAGIELEIRSGSVTLRLSDNGRGFDTGGEFEGHGLASMRDRVRRIGGTITIDSTPGTGSGTGTGTTLIVTVPIAERQPGKPI